MLFIDFSKWGNFIRLFFFNYILVLFAILAFELNVDAKDDKKDFKYFRNVFNELISFACCRNDWGDRLAEGIQWFGLDDVAEFVHDKIVSVDVVSVSELFEFLDHGAEDFEETEDFHEVVDLSLLNAWASEGAIFTVWIKLFFLFGQENDRPLTQFF